MGDKRLGIKAERQYLRTARCLNQLAERAVALQPLQRQ